MQVQTLQVVLVAFQHEREVPACRQAAEDDLQAAHRERPEEELGLGELDLEELDLEDPGEAAHRWWGGEHHSHVGCQADQQVLHHGAREGVVHHGGNREFLHNLEEGLVRTVTGCAYLEPAGWVRSGDEEACSADRIPSYHDHPAVGKPPVPEDNRVDR
jgi:hypothetical protein